jgi:hypothetical protein
MRMTREGHSPDEIRRFIDRKYASAQDQSTHTPLPPLPASGRSAPSAD